MGRSPYRESGREACAWRPRLRDRSRSAVARLIGAPRYVGLVVAGVAAVTFGGLNADAGSQDCLLAPDTVIAGNLAAVALLLTIPFVLLMTMRAWRGLPLPRAKKRGHTWRAVAVQIAAVAVALVLVVGLRPASPRVLARATRADGRTAYAYAYGCSYGVGVDVGAHTVRVVAHVGPFECDAAPPRVEWRNRDDVVLLGADETILGVWPRRLVDYEDQLRFR
ncbi:MAG: hypothetical protein KF819_36045 [Labilithrix sp.]|nr:hypothetical protein [Labilithrix sp.]